MRRSGRRRYITRGEAVDQAEYEPPFSPTPSNTSLTSTGSDVGNALLRAHTFDYPTTTLTSSPMSRSRSESRPSTNLSRSHTFDQPASSYNEARDKLMQLDPRPHSFRVSRRDSSSSDVSSIQHDRSPVPQEKSPLRTDSAASAASTASASTTTLVDTGLYPGRARWHQEDPSRSPLMSRSPQASSSTRTLSSESEGFGSVARKGLVSRDKHKEQPVLNPPPSPVIEHAPTRARTFVGRSSTAESSEDLHTSPSRHTARFASWRGPLTSTQEDQPPQWVVQSESSLVHQASTDSTKSPDDDNLSKAEKIRREYKEKRRKELASMFGGVQKAASFDTADIKSGDEPSYVKYRRSSSREENKISQGKTAVAPPVATVSPMVTPTQTVTTSKGQTTSQYPMVAVITSPSTPLKVTADVGTLTSTVGTQTPSPTTTAQVPKQSIGPSQLVTSSAEPNAFSPRLSERRSRRDGSPVKNRAGSPNKQRIQDTPRLPNVPWSPEQMSSERSRSQKTQEMTKVQDTKAHEPKLYQPPKVHEPVQPKAQDRSRQSTLSAQLLSPGKDNRRSASATRYPASTVTLEPLSSLLPSRNNSRPSSTTPQSQTLEPPQQPARPSSTSNKGDMRQIIRPQPIRPTVVAHRDPLSPNKMLLPKGAPFSSASPVPAFASNTSPFTSASAIATSQRSQGTIPRQASPATSSSAHLSTPSSRSPRPSPSPVPQATISVQYLKTEVIASLAPTCSTPASTTSVSVTSVVSSVVSNAPISSAITESVPSQKVEYSKTASKPLSRSSDPVTTQTSEFAKESNISESVTPKGLSQTESKPVFAREDSFNRPDSPPRQLIPLPKDSVIARNRRKNISSSSSTEGTPTVSPVTSPLTGRRRTRGQPHEPLFSPQPRKHRQGKSRSRAGRSKSPRTASKESRTAGKPSPKTSKSSPKKHPKTETEVIPQVESQVALKPTETPKPAASITSAQPQQSQPNQQEEQQHQQPAIKSQPEAAMGQGHSAASPGMGDIHLSDAMKRSSLPWNTDNHMTSQRNTMPSQNVPHGILPPTSALSATHTGSPVPEMGVRHIERRQSDSSSTTSTSRRRYRQRDQSADSPSLEHVVVRPGKKDKSLARKSSLNVSTDSQNGPPDLGSRVRDHTPISSDDGDGRRRSRYDQIQSSHAKSGVAELSLSPPPTPAGDPFKVTEEFVSEHMASKSPQVTVFPPVRHERPKSYVTRGSHDHIHSNDRPLSQQDYRTLSQPERIKVTERSQSFSPSKTQQSQHGEVTAHQPVVGVPRPMSPVKSLPGGPMSPVRTQPSMGLTYGGPVSPTHTQPGPMSPVQVSTGPMSPVRSQALSQAQTSVGPFPPVRGETAPLSPVRSQVMTQSQLPGGPYSPTRSQSGPLSPVRSQTGPLSPGNSHTGPTSPVKMQAGSLSYVGSLSPVRTPAGPLSSSSGSVSPSYSQPGQLSSRSHGSTAHTPTTLTPKYENISQSSKTGPTSPTSSQTWLSSSTQSQSQPEFASTLGQSSRSPIPAPVTSLSPQLSPVPLSPALILSPVPPKVVKQAQPAPVTAQVTSSTDASGKVQPTTPRFVPYTIKDLETNLKQTESQAGQVTLQTTVKTPVTSASAQPSLMSPKASTTSSTSIIPEQPSSSAETKEIVSVTSLAPSSSSSSSSSTSSSTSDDSAKSAKKPPTTTSSSSSSTTTTTTSTASEDNSKPTSKEVPDQRSSDEKSDRKTPPSDSEPPTRVEAAIYKLQERKRSTDSPIRDDTLAQLRNKGSCDVSQLVRRFSTDRSGSDKEGSPADGTIRRTPDRTQSFRERTPDRKVDEPFIRARSFREKRSADSNVADEQLRDILSRRSRNLDEWEDKVSGQTDEEKDRKTAELKAAHTYESRFKEKHSPSPVHIDSELSSALKLRREKEERESTVKFSDSDSDSLKPILKNTPTQRKDQPHGILKKGEGQVNETHVTSILKKAVPSDESPPKPILKRDSVELEAQPVSILKHETEHDQSIQPISILKRESVDEQSEMPASILKHKDTSEEEDSKEEDIKPILKKDVGHVEQKPLPILKHENAVIIDAAIVNNEETVSVEKTSLPAKEAVRESVVPDRTTSGMPVIKPSVTNQVTPVVKQTPLTNSAPRIKEVYSQEAKTLTSAIKSESDVKQVSNGSENARQAVKQKHNTFTQSVNLRPLVRDMPGVQRTSRTTINLTRSESLRDEASKDIRPALRKTQTVDLGGLEGERAACNLPENISEQRKRTFHSPTPEPEPQGAEVEAKRVSVAERIFQMETRVEEAMTPRSGTSGVMTPRIIKLRSSSGPSGTVSPTRRVSGQSLAQPSLPALVDEQLMAKLGDMAVLQEAATRRQEQQQSTRLTRSEPRRRTQPVTQEEFQEANALESVLAFKKEISSNTLINAFKKTYSPDIVRKSKGQETFPQPFHRQKLQGHRKDKRYQTQPVTVHELSEIPELLPLSATMAPAKPKTPSVASDSDFELDQLVEVNYIKLTGQMPYQVVSTPANPIQLAQDKPEAQDEYSKMSVSEKMSLFRKLEEPKAEPTTPRSRRRFQDRKQRLERSRTQPITEEELSQASEIAKEGSKQETETDNGETGAGDADKDTEDSDKTLMSVSCDNVAKLDLAEDATVDELSRLSLADKMKLFSENKTEEQTKRDAPVLRRKARRTQSRFKTQPVTVEEVEKARISPLAATMVKPPDPEILQNMTVKDQRAFVAQWAQSALKPMEKKESTEKISETASAVPQANAAVTAAVTVTETATTQTATVVTTAPSKETATPTVTAVTDTADVIETTEQNTEYKITNKVIKTNEGTSKKEELRKNRQRQLEQRLQDSSTEDENFEKIQRIKNEAIARRRRMMEMRKSGESRYHTQPVEASEPAEESKDVRPSGGHMRHHTQPITEQEKLQLEGDAPGPPSPNARGSILERSGNKADENGLAALKQHGEQDWKKRVRGKDLPKDIDFSQVKLRDKTKLKAMEAERPHSIADRLSKLETAQDTWKDRVEDKDVNQFTVEGKLNKAGKIATPDSPIIARRRKMRAPLTREEDDDQVKEVKPDRSGRPPPYPVTPPGTKTRFSHDLENVLASSRARKAQSSPLPLPVEETSDMASSERDEKEPTKIEIPRPDEEFDNFFEERTAEELSKSKIDVTVDDFDHLFLESEDMLSTAKKIRPQRKKPTTKNPLKALAARDDIQLEYTEVRSDIADKELRRIKREQIAGTVGFAQEALAGLASKENFSKVTLRKTDSFGSSTPGGGLGKYEPFKDVMLLHIKGRRHCQVRLVEPKASSLNSGDSFVLVTSDKVYIWIGEYCNIIEKSKSTEVAAIVQQKRDLGCKSHQEPITIYEKRQDSPASKGFWEALGGKQSYQDPGPPEEDELFEMYMTETNRVWMLDTAAEQLVELDDYQGTVLPHALLHTKATLVFDFGAEMYVWTGKQVPFATRKLALKLAREIWDKGYDYSKCDINPLCPLKTPENGGLAFQGTRPDWTLFAKVNENMETILFREKFADWPDSSRLIKVRQDSDEQKTEPVVDLQPYDAAKMIAVNYSPVDLLLEGNHIGRGQKWVEAHEGIRREFEILTLDIQSWHILEYDHSMLAEDSHGQFHDGDTYVVRWHYMISQAGRTLKGAEARHSMTGRERCAYFFWQGRNSSINEKGASALMTVELDEERGPQVRVVQGKEPPCFIQLFKGRMVTHLGKREDESTNTQGPYRMYMLRNELAKEAYLAEVRCQVANLRSRGVFLLLNVKTGLCYMWLGCKAAQPTKDRARELANNLVNKCPLEIGLHERAQVTITEIQEGKEKSEFWAALDSSQRSLYYSLLSEAKPCQYTLRIFSMTSVSGVFEATELLNPCRSAEVACAFPFIQADLYRLSQPGLVMVDAGPEIWLWQGWWPEGTEESDNVKTGSAHARFNIDRKLGLQTTVSYCREKFGVNGAKDRAWVTYAGLEPLCFKNLFPHWKNCTDVTEIQLKEGRHEGDRRSVEDLLQQLNRTCYAWSELQQHPLPEGVDPLKLESYLNNEEFLEMLGMSKEDFYALPSWKQGNLKKTVGLF